MGSGTLDELAAVLLTPVPAQVAFTLAGGWRAALRWALPWTLPLLVWNPVAVYFAPIDLELPMVYAGLAYFAFLIFGGPWWLLDRLDAVRTAPRSD